MIKLKQVNGGVVTSLDDALLYSKLYTGSGIISGCTVTLTGNNQLNIADGRGVACGRFFTISGDESVLAQLSTSGTMQGRVLVRIDLSNIQSPISIVTQVAETLPDLVQEDLNAGGDVYEIPLATYQVTETAVSGLTSSPQAAVWELDKKAPSNADYVVETGNTGIWYYRKWKSGYAECWGNMSTYNSTNPVDLPFALSWGFGWAGLTTYNNTTAQAFLSVTVTTSTAELTGYDTSGEPVNEFHARVYIFGALQ